MLQTYWHVSTLSSPTWYRTNSVQLSIPLLKFFNLYSQIPNWAVLARLGFGFTFFYLAL